MIRIGLIGAGGYARVYINHLLSCHTQKKLEFCGVVIRPQDRPNVLPGIESLESEGIPIFSNKEDLYATAMPDVVALPVAIGSHCPLAVDAVNHGINVIVEKPAAGSVAEIDKMEEAAERTGKFIIVGFQHIYAPDIRDLKARLLAGEFGKVQRIASLGVWPRGEKYYGRNEWVCRLHGANGEPVYDSPANNAFAHYLNLALFFSGMEMEKSAHAVEMCAELYRARKNIETFDSCAMKLKTRNGVEILTLFSHCSHDNVEPVLRLETDRGLILWNEKDSWTFHPDSGGPEIQGGPASDGRGNMFSLLIRKAAGEKVFTCSLSIAREHTFCIENTHKHFHINELKNSEYTMNPENGCFEIPNIAEDFRRCFQAFQLPSQYGVPWGKPSPTVNLA